jgi:CheY-like chemotaxis protein
MLVFLDEPSVNYDCHPGRCGMVKLLVVDDDSMLRECIVQILSSKGYLVVEAKDGVEALMEIRQSRDEISLVLMDVMMPRMDGIAATALIKLADPSMKVILMSGKMPEALEAGKADAFLCKPFQSKDLIEVVQRNLKTHLLPDDPKAAKAALESITNSDGISMSGAADPAL